ncbi:MAG: rRNA pseudouridine synthase [Acidobacteria bacterium]|jgi:pseudouridine synthase|nr:rRNA pseudouridine synthase [Acidobacteriota bacterium]
MAEERLQKILARAGIASRRAAEQLMREGRVTVNGTVADRLGMHADPDRDHIKVDGRRLRPAAPTRTYLLAFKPREMITSLADPEGRTTVADLLQAHRVRPRVFPVGRLDWDADGLLILTDDGELANRVMHPRSHLPKTYRVKVRGTPDERALDRVRRGVVIERGVRTLPAQVRVDEPGDNASWLTVVLTEGRQNQIKLMFARVGHPVQRIRRTAIGPLRLGKMRVGELRAMTAAELEALRGALDLAESRSPGREGRGRPPALPPGARPVRQRPPGRGPRTARKRIT